MKLIKYTKKDINLYDETLKLRDEILRKPLGKSIFEEDLEIEKDNNFYGIIVDKKLIATLSYYEEKVLVVHLVAFAVLDKYQNKGYGTEIFNFLVDDLRKNNYNKINVNARSTAVNFYKKLGFKIFNGPVYNKDLGIEDYIMEYLII